jgi:alpha-mannosidase
MDEFPEFRITQSHASVDEIARRHNPALCEGNKARVAAGRWEVAASQRVEGDENLASGEAIARSRGRAASASQLRYGISEAVTGQS